MNIRQTFTLIFMYDIHVVCNTVESDRNHEIAVVESCKLGK